MPNRNLVGDYRYDYQGQELDKETGKVAFELRLYDPRINRWLTTDPAGQYHSPYMAMGNNWMNGVDPDGAEYNPVYGANGEGFLGTTESGFVGEALIMNPDDFTQGMADSDAFSTGTFLSDFNFSSSSIRDAIESHIVNYTLGDGLDSVNSICIENSITDRFNYSADKATPNDLTILRGVNKNGRSLADEYFKPTVENLRNVVNLHEAGVTGKGHVLGNLSGTAKDHFIIYEAQVNHKQFHSTTADFKGYTLNKLYDAGESSGNSIMNNPVYKNMYYKLGGYDYRQKHY